MATNLALTGAWSTNGLLLDTNGQARLVYRDVETNVSTNFYPANIDFHTGSVIWWFNPDWSTGTGPSTAARLMDVMVTNQGATWEWWVQMEAGGTNLTFNLASNGAATVLTSNTVSWTWNTWHQVVLTYGPTSSFLFVDGYFQHLGLGVTNWPGLEATNQAFAVGSDLATGNLQMRGVLADLETYNYPLTADQVADSFNAVEPGGADYSILFNATYTSNAVVTAAISGWPSASMMILVNSTNTNAGVWVPFNANPTINLGSGDGPKTVNMYFNSLSNVSSFYSFTLWLDTTPPVLTFTCPGPGTNTVNQPLLQLQGYAPEELSSVTYDIANAAGSVTKQPAVVTSRYFDTNQWRFTTNTFQAFDVGLTVGANQITVHAKDLAGNMTTSNLTVTLDYTGKSNPVLTLYWPTNGAEISGTNFVWRGSVDDPTVTLSAQIVDASGDTNVVTGIVERNGNFWVENLPLASGINSLTLTATDAAGNVSQTNISVTQSLVNIAITSVPAVSNQLTVTVLGTLDTAGYTVWVNGVKATQSGSPPSINWEADNVPVNGLGTTVFEALAIANTDNGGNGTSGSGGGGTNSTLQNPGNPVPAVVSPVAQVEQDTQPALICTYFNLYYDILWTAEGTTPQPNGFGTISNYLTYEAVASDYWAYASSGESLNTSWAPYYGGDGIMPLWIGFGASFVSWDQYGNAMFVEYYSPTNNDYSQPYVSYGTVGMYGPGYPPEESSYQASTGLEGTGLIPYAPVLDIPAVYHVSRGVVTSCTLRTGGKAASGLTGLFGLFVTATNMTQLGNPNYPLGIGVPVPYNHITVMGQTLGADGNHWVIEPDGISVPVPVVVPGSVSFYYSILPAKYKAFFTAYFDMPGPPPSHVTHIGTDYGHAWWMLSTDAPVAGIRAALGTTPLGIEFLNIQVGYADHGHPIGPGVLRDPETNTNISESKQYQIGFCGSFVD